MSSTAAAPFSVFTGNVGIFGGALLIARTPGQDEFPQITLFNISFTSNYASVAGGAIYFNLIALSAFDLVRFANNDAMFGPNFASTPTEFEAKLAFPPCAAQPSAVDTFIASGCQLSLVIEMLDSYGQVVYQLPPADSILESSLAIEFGAEGCVSALSLDALTYSPLAENLTISGGVGSSYVIWLNTPGSTVTSNNITGTVGGCTIGYQAPTLQNSTECGRCSLCTPGSFNVNGDGVCRICADEQIWRCYGPYVWAEGQNWVVYSNSTRTVTALACEHCRSACTLNSVQDCAENITLAEPITCYSVANSSSIVDADGYVGMSHFLVR